MRIESFWAKGFRSLRDVRLDGLGPFNVFYGPNGSGKSNILAAMDVWLRLATIALDSEVEPIAPRDLRAERARGKLALEGSNAPVRLRDFTLSFRSRRMSLEGTLVDVSPDVRRVKISVQLDATIESRPMLMCDFLEIDDIVLERGDVQPKIAYDDKLSALRRVDLVRKLSLVPADRMPRSELAGEPPPVGTEPLSWHFRRGHLKNALFAAQNAPSPDTLRALDRFREIMSGPPLYRPPFRAVEDPHTSLRDLHEQLPPPFEDQDMSLDLAGLGIAQIYWILAQAMLSGADMIAVEEPEAHLHAPTSGRHLRQLLERLVNEKHIEQLFIATHSNLFDLDPKGYWDVSLWNGATVVERADLTRIDRDHLYEPGPVKHALRKVLEYMPPEEIAFRRGDGSPISTAEMLQLLQDDDDLAVEFLKDIQGAAVRMVKVQNKLKKPAGS
jgi:hypothetical protein